MIHITPKEEWKPEGISSSKISELAIKCSTEQYKTISKQKTYEYRSDKKNTEYKSILGIKSNGLLEDVVMARNTGLFGI